jgi:RNA polymerase sigma factor (sigma-70 family)
MNKQVADKIITEYYAKIYGFAIKKSFSYDEAEELASDMAQEVYLSLLRTKEIVNLEGWIWRICEHTYARYVAQKKKQKGISIDGISLEGLEGNLIPIMDKYSSDYEDEIAALRREIAFLSATRRRIIYSFYFERNSIAKIAVKLEMPEGTVKWHLNKARNELKEGFFMERTISSLGINPKTAINFGHNGCPGENGGPEYYLGDKLNVNIVYSVYYEPKTRKEIAQELGVTPAVIEDKFEFLEANGYLIPLKGGKYTTYVKFTPEKYSREMEDKGNELEQKVAELLVKEYVPLVLDAVSKCEDVYIPSGNRQMVEAFAIWATMQKVVEKKCNIDISKYYIQDTAGGKYIAHVDFENEYVDEDYVKKYHKDNMWACGAMTRCSNKYENLISWSVDSKYCSREGGWKNNLTCDYEYLYEFIKGDIKDCPKDAEKFERLRERKFLTEDNKIGIMVCRQKMDDFFALLPEIPETVEKVIRQMALEYALLVAKYYPPQMQDLIVYYVAYAFPNNEVFLRMLDILYENGTFQSLTEAERVTSQLMMFCDVLP